MYKKNNRIATGVCLVVPKVFMLNQLQSPFARSGVGGRREVISGRRTRQRRRRRCSVVSSLRAN